MDTSILWTSTTLTAAALTVKFFNLLLISVYVQINDLYVTLDDSSGNIDRKLLRHQVTSSHFPETLSRPIIV